MKVCTLLIGSILWSALPSMTQGIQDVDNAPMNEVPNAPDTVEYVNVLIIFTNAYNDPLKQKKFKRLTGSLLLRTTVPVKFYIVGDVTSQDEAVRILKTADASEQGKKYKVVPVDHQTLESQVEAQLEDLRPSYHNRVNSNPKPAMNFLSVVMHRVMPSDLDQIIMLSEDVKFQADIYDLYLLFQEFSKDNVIGIAHEMQPTYRQMFLKHRMQQKGTRIGEPAPFGHPGFNNGVLLLDLKKMRNSVLYNSLLTQQNLMNLSKEYFFEAFLGDQELFSLLGCSFDELFYILPCQWNRQLCDWWRHNGFNDVFHMYYNCEADVKIYQGNCNTIIPEE